MYRVRRVLLLMLCSKRSDIKMVVDEGLLSNQLTRNESAELPEGGVDRLLSQQSIMQQQPLVIRAGSLAREPLLVHVEVEENRPRLYRVAT